MIDKHFFEHIFRKVEPESFLYEFLNSENPTVDGIFHTERNFLFLKTSQRRVGVKRQEIKATFHLTISMRGQRATGKIQRNNHHHGSCEPSLTAKTMSVFLIFTQETHRNVKNSLQTFSVDIVHRQLIGTE